MSRNFGNRLISNLNAKFFRLSAKFRLFPQPVKQWPTDQGRLSPNPNNQQNRNVKFVEGLVSPFTIGEHWCVSHH
jgi:hypothetical protein